MDWPLAISRNREALRDIVAALLALFGAATAALTSPGLSRRSLGEGGRGPVTLPRHVYAAIMLVLRPAESAVRRLIILAALGLVLKPHTPRPAPVGLSAFPAAGGLKFPAFALLDPLKSFDPDAIWDNDAPLFVEVHGNSDHAPGFREVPSLLAPVNANLIGLRLAALRRALDDLPRQARRLVRWQARRDALLAKSRPTRLSPFRPGLPPGWRERPRHEIDAVLRECHGLAIQAVNRPDTG